jgi:6-phospho-beta-glucosidase
MFLDPLVHGVWPPALLALLEQHQVTWEASASSSALASHVT